MTRLALLLALAMSTACATVRPMQTASTVAPGVTRVGGQLSAAAFCGYLPGGILAMTRCTEYPDGLPLPELRANGRRGLARNLDAGLSLQLQGQLLAVERPFQLGVAGDLKYAFFDDGANVVSVGGLVGTALALRAGLAPWWQVEFDVPLFYGRRFDAGELALGLSGGGRGTFPSIGGTSFTPVTFTPRVGLTLGWFPKPTAWAVQLAYLVDPFRFDSGAIQLQFGWFFDLGP